jgi:hypothetical protein
MYQGISDRLTRFRFEGLDGEMVGASELPYPWPGASRFERELRLADGGIAPTVD